MCGFQAYHRAGSTNQSSSHSHPRGGRKRSCLSFTFPVTSENLCRPTRPVVPHLPSTQAWFSYCGRKAGDSAIKHSHMIEMRSLLEKAPHHFSINAKASLWEAVKLFLQCRQAEPHADPQLNGDLQPFILIHRVLINKKEACSVLIWNIIMYKYLIVSSLTPAWIWSGSIHSASHGPVRWSSSTGSRLLELGHKLRASLLSTSRWSHLACCSEAVEGKLHLVAQHANS